MTKREAGRDDVLRIAVLLGDGIGPEVVPCAVDVLARAAERHRESLVFTELPIGLAAIETHGSTLPSTTLDQLQQHDAWVLGPVSHHAYPVEDVRYVSPSGYLRKHFDLFANIRTVRSEYGVRPLRAGIDLAIVRENTEGFYADRNVLDGNGELRPDADTVVSVRIVTRRACERIARQAFELAYGRRKRVTIVHKANVLRRGDGLFVATCLEVARQFPDVAVDDLHVDAFATQLVIEPTTFDVVVTTNMFGDITSGEAAGLVGGLGFAPSLNSGARYAMAQAAHGSAPQLAGKATANPVATILSVQMLAAWLARKHGRPGLAQAANDIEAAVARALADPANHTPDAGGTASTRDLAGAIAGQLGTGSEREGDVTDALMHELS